MSRFLAGDCVPNPTADPMAQGGPIDEVACPTERPSRMSDSADREGECKASD